MTVKELIEKLKISLFYTFQLYDVRIEFSGIRDELKFIVYLDRNFNNFSIYISNYHLCEDLYNAIYSAVINEAHSRGIKFRNLNQIFKIQEITI